MARKQPVRRTARTNQFYAFPAKLIVCAQQVIEQIDVILQESHLIGCCRRLIEKTERGLEIAERIDRVSLLKQGLEHRVSRVQRIAGRQRQLAGPKYVQEGRENVVGRRRIAVQHIEARQAYIGQIQLGQ